MLPATYAAILSVRGILLVESYMRYGCSVGLPLVNDSFRRSVPQALKAGHLKKLVYIPQSFPCRDSERSGSCSQGSFSTFVVKFHPPRRREFSTDMHGSGKGWGASAMITLSRRCSYSMFIYPPRWASTQERPSPSER